MEEQQEQQSIQKLRHIQKGRHWPEACTAGDQPNMDSCKALWGLQFSSEIASATVTLQLFSDGKKKNLYKLLRRHTRNLWRCRCRTGDGMTSKYTRAAPNTLTPPSGWLWYSGLVSGSPLICSLQARTDTWIWTIKEFDLCVFTERRYKPLWLFFPDLVRKKDWLVQNVTTLIWNCCQ